MTAWREEILAEGVRLICGDCREVLPTLGKVDAVVTDPPYSGNTHAMAKTNKGKGHGTKLVTFASLDDAEFIAVVEKMLEASAGWVIMTCDYRHAALFFDDPRFIRLGAWVKPNPMPQISADRPGQGFETVAILHSGHRPKAWARGGAAGVWTVPVVNGADVPTQKPLRLAMAFVSDFTERGEVIADPFLGSGTTGVAAVKLGRQFVGIEADAKHFDIACRRVSDALKQPDMFIERPTPPKQEALL
jgi:site-specific DNA-methyltransferase (adenine-specific)